MTNQWYPHVTVAAICEQDGQFLMVEEHSTANSHTVINQPAGHVEKDESIVEAVIRETLEETCWQFTPEALYRFIPLDYPTRQNLFKIYILWKSISF